MYRRRNSVLFQLVLLFWYETQGLRVSLGVTDFRQAKGTADGSFGPSNGINGELEKPEGIWDCHRGSQDRQFSPLLWYKKIQRIGSVFLHLHCSC